MFSNHGSRLSSRWNILHMPRKSPIPHHGVGRDTFLLLYDWKWSRQLRKEDPAVEIDGLRYIPSLLLVNEWKETIKVNPT